MDENASSCSFTHNDSNGEINSHNDLAKGSGFRVGRAQQNKELGMCSGGPFGKYRCNREKTRKCILLQAASERKCLSSSCKDPAINSATRRKRKKAERMGNELLMNGKTILPVLR